MKALNRLQAVLGSKALWLGALHSRNTSGTWVVVTTPASKERITMS
ncbi:MAG: hypothetical protein WAL87_10270 [Chthoniobacterales bacterium]